MLNCLDYDFVAMSVDFAQISSTRDQRPTVTTPVTITMNQNDAINGIEHDSNSPADIRIKDSGVYVIIAAPQVGRISGDEPRYIDFWLRKNSRDVQNSTIRYVFGNHRSTDVVISQCMMPLSEGDVLNYMMAVEVPNEGLGITALAPPGRPAIPSIIFSMLKIKDQTVGHWVSTGKGTGRTWQE